MRLFKRTSFAMGALLAVMALSACDMSTPSQVQTGKLRVTNQMVVETLDAQRVDTGRVFAIADSFLTKGKGDMAITISYLDGNENFAAAAEKQGKAYKDAFAKLGVSASVVTVPVSDRRYTGEAIVTYRALAALPPKDCTRIPGYQGADPVEAMQDYKIGCEVQTVMGKMVADPSDLLGKSGTQNSDSRRSGSVVETHKAGTPNTLWKTFNASTIGQ